VVANETISDIDLFVDGPRTAAAVVDRLERAPDGRRLFKKVVTENATTVYGHQYPAQVITRWTFANPVNVSRSFDFTVCSSALWFGECKWQSCCDDSFYADLASKRLVYRNPERNEDAGGSLLRVLKYYQRGYRIPLDSLAEVIVRLFRGVEANMLARLATGEASEYDLTRVLVGLLREVDPLVDLGHISHLPAEDVPGNDPDKVPLVVEIPAVTETHAV
jgi:hypothetical protein